MEINNIRGLFRGWLEQGLSRHAEQCLRSNMMCGFMEYSKICMRNLIKEIGGPSSQNLTPDMIGHLYEIADIVDIEMPLHHVLIKAAVKNREFCDNIRNSNENCRQPNLCIGKNGTIISMSFILSSVYLPSLLKHQKEISKKVESVWIELKEQMYSPFGFSQVSYDPELKVLTIKAAVNFGEYAFVNSLGAYQSREIEWFYRYATGDYFPSTDPESIIDSALGTINSRIRKLTVADVV